MKKQRKHTKRYEYQKRYLDRRPERVEKQRIATRTAFLRNLYGITPEDYDEMLRLQGGVCATCESVSSDKFHKRLSIDHDKESGEVRGLLCTKCNLIVGLCREDFRILVNIANYLAIYKEQEKHLIRVHDEESTLTIN